MKHEAGVENTAITHGDNEVSFYSKVGSLLLIGAASMLVTSVVTRDGVWAVAGALFMISFGLLVVAEMIHKKDVLIK